MDNTKAMNSYARNVAATVTNAGDLANMIASVFHLNPNDLAVKDAARSALREAFLQTMTAGQDGNVNLFTDAHPVSALIRWAVEQEETPGVDDVAADLEYAIDQLTRAHQAILRHGIVEEA